MPVLLVIKMSRTHKGIQCKPLFARSVDSCSSDTVPKHILEVFTFTCEYKIN